MKTINNNIEQKIVGFDNAKLLKEKKFNVPCQYLYVDKEYRINNEKVGDVFDNKVPSSQIPIDWVLAPTQQVVIDFIRINFDIYINLDLKHSKSIGVHYGIDIWKHIIDVELKYISTNISEMFRTSEEVKEIAINYVLTNLI